jgi:uncharacterized protein YndB with AHSA1/START domain
MTSSWTKTFEVSVPIERLWRAFTEEGEQRRSPSPEGASRKDPNASAKVHVLEVQPMKLLRWTQDQGTMPERTECRVVFESTDGGSRFTVTRFGFGEGEDADVFSEANALGWENGFRDLVLSLETGIPIQRHYFGVPKSSVGALLKERIWGLEILKVLPGSFAAEVGLARGDRLVRMAGAAIYSRSNVWMLMEEHPPGTWLEVEFIRGRELMRGRGRLASYGAAELTAIGE